MNYSENAKTYAEYSWQLTAIILRRPCLERLCACKASTWSVCRAPEEGWAASPHTDFSAADFRAGANTEFGPELPVQRRLRYLPSTSRSCTASRLRPSRCSPRPSHGGQEAAVAGPPRALLKASQARPRRGIPAEEGAAR